MSSEAVFLCVVGVIAGCFGLVNAALFLLLQKKTARAVGTVVSIKMPNPETARTRNSKWAVVSYEVDGRLVQSGNRIQVPMTRRWALLYMCGTINRNRKSCTPFRWDGWRWRFSLLWYASLS